MNLVQRNQNSGVLGITILTGKGKRKVYYLTPSI